MDVKAEGDRLASTATYVHAHIHNKDRITTTTSEQLRST